MKPIYVCSLCVILLAACSEKPVSEVDRLREIASYERDQAACNAAIEATERARHPDLTGLTPILQKPDAGFSLARMNSGSDAPSESGRTMRMAYELHAPKIDNSAKFNEAECDVLNGTVSSIRLKH